MLDLRRDFAAQLSDLTERYAGNPEAQRLILLTTAIYGQLPRHDRQLLDALVMGIDCDGEPHSDDPTLGFTAVTDHYSEFVRISLAQAKLARSDGAARFIIAHALAHVVLRHWQLSPTVGEGVRRLYRLNHWSDQQAWEEDFATLQVSRWGLVEEMAVFFAEFPEARRPAGMVHHSAGAGASLAAQCLEGAVPPPVA